MTFNEVFTAYYSQFRADSDIPAGEGLASTAWDDEYTVGMRLANEAINRWAFYDNTYWKELFTTAQTEQDGDLSIVTSQTEYAAPDNFQEAGGFIKVLDSNGNTAVRYPIIEPHEAQFKGDNSDYAYFTGDPGNGFTLHLGSVPTSSINGFDIDYVYYKTPTTFTTGTDVTEMADPYFIVHRLLASQFRAARNPYYSSAKSDAENALRQMQLTNNSGTWANPITMGETSGSQFGR